MPAGTFTVYSAAIEGIARANIDLDNATWVATLHSAAYTPAPDADATWANVSASELATGNGYTAGGQVLSAVTVSRSGGTITFDAGDLSWPSSTLTARWVVITRRSGGALVAGDLLLGYAQLETGGAGTVSTTNGTLAVNWNAAGLFTMARA